jgi:hypothetical protein
MGTGCARVRRKRCADSQPWAWLVEKHIPAGPWMNHGMRTMSGIAAKLIAMALNAASISRRLALVFVCCGLLGLTPAPAERQSEPIQAIGCFANIHADGEAAYGYVVQLWLRGRQIIGLIEYYSGDVADPPMGIISKVRYDSSTGKISFTAKLTTGLHSCRVHKDVPSHDLLSFRGLLRPDRLEGAIHLENQLDSPPVIIEDHENIQMPRDPGCLVENYEDYDAWWAYWQPVYKRRGAKW